MAHTVSIAEAPSMADAPSIADLLQKINTLEKEIQDMKNNEQAQKQLADAEALQQQADINQQKLADQKRCACYICTLSGLA